MFCIKCGTKLPDFSRSCPEYGSNRCFYPHRVVNSYSGLGNKACKKNNQSSKHVTTICLNY